MPFSISGYTVVNLTETFYPSVPLTSGSTYSHNWQIHEPQSVHFPLGYSHDAHWTRYLTITANIASKYGVLYGGAYCGVSSPITYTWTEVWSNSLGESHTYVETGVEGTGLIPSVDFFGIFTFGKTYEGILVRCGAAGQAPGHPPPEMHITSLQIHGETVNFRPFAYIDTNISGVAGGNTMDCSCISPRIYNGIGINQYWRPSVEYSIQYNPLDLSGNPVMGKKVYIVIGDFWAYDHFDLFRKPIIGDDVSQYVRESTTPVNETISIDGRCTRLNSSGQTGILSPSSVYQTSQHDDIVSTCQRVGVIVRRNNFNLADPSYPYQEIDPSSPLIVSQPTGHLWVDDADCSGIEYAHIELPSSKNLDTGSWSASGSGASVSGNQLTAGASVGTFTNVLSPKTLATPWRWFAFDYNVISGNPALTVLEVGNSGGSASTQKEYSISPISGTGTAYIDTLQPDKVGGSTPTDKMEKNASFTLGYGNNRFDGFKSIYSMIIKFSNAVVEITNMRMVVRYEAKFTELIAPGIGAIESLTPFSDISTKGQVDGKYLFQNFAMGVDISSLLSSTGITVLDSDYSLSGHSPYSSLNGAGTPSILSPLDSSHSFIGEQTLTGSTKLCASVIMSPPRIAVNSSTFLPQSTGGIVFPWGMKNIGWFNTARAIGLWGNEYSATAVIKTPSSMIYHSPLFANETFTYKTGVHGFGKKDILKTRYQSFQHPPPFAPTNVEHYEPGELPSPTKALTRNDGFNTVYHIYVEGTKTAGSDPANTHFDSTNEYFTAHVEEGDIFVMVSQFSIPVDDFSYVVRVTDTGNNSSPEVGIGTNGIFYVLYNNGTDSVYRFSTDQGRTWSDEVTLINNGLYPRMAVSPDGTIIWAAFKYNSGSSGPGKIYTILYGPGMSSVPSAVIAKDETNSDIVVADDRFDISYSNDKHGRWLLFCRLDGDTELTHYTAADRTPTWTKVYP